SVEDEVIQAAPRMRIAPNPIFGSAELSIDSKVDKPTQVNIYNLKGQMVREFTLDSPQTRMVWDTKDDSGIRLSSGIYFISWKQGSHTGKDKVLIMR
nr:T9SS type A sorting domain-containing protein [Candidatus Cloacimonadota bacterium]